MSISLATAASVFMEFIDENLIPILDKNNPDFPLCIEKWQQLTQRVLKKISSFKNNEEFKQNVKRIGQTIIKKSNDQPINNGQNKQKSNAQKSLLHVSFEQTDKNNKPKKLQFTSPKIESKSKEETIQFRDRKTSVDEFAGRKQQIQQSSSNGRKQQRSNSFHVGLQNQITVIIPLVLSPNQQQSSQKQRTSFSSGKQGQILSFKSISDYSRSRNNIPSTIKQTKESQNSQNLITQPPQLKLMSKKSIQEFSAASITQTRPNSYSSNYIDSIKKINTDSRSPNQKIMHTFIQLDSSNDYTEHKTIRNQQNQVNGNNNEQATVAVNQIGSINKTNTQGVQSAMFPHGKNSSQSFLKFMGSFKKLCTTFESNHQKLLREDFNNKYINC